MSFYLLPPVSYQNQQKLKQSTKKKSSSSSSSSSKHKKDGSKKERSHRSSKSSRSKDHEVSEVLSASPHTIQSSIMSDSIDESSRSIFTTTSIDTSSLKDSTTISSDASPKSDTNSLTTLSKRASILSNFDIKSVKSTKEKKTSESSSAFNYTFNSDINDAINSSRRAKKHSINTHKRSISINSTNSGSIHSPISSYVDQGSYRSVPTEADDETDHDPLLLMESEESDEDNDVNANQDFSDVSSIFSSRPLSYMDTKSSASSRRIEHPSGHKRSSD
ncbi:hypothetical protein DFJ63DRAFT_314498 [Scheffersomyces coipomensis]|uniref:uncharacterized protein n=1 Tax=Scheffersomyces coipomensis TaxID=1788519 RepID=UPI00315DB9B9